MKSIMQHSFSNVPDIKTPRSVFNRDHAHKTTFDSGYLVPVFVDIAYPGDTFNLSMTHFARLSTPIKPIMDNLYLDSFFFSCPIRLVWDNFTKFMGEKVNPDDDIDYLIPTMTAPVGGFSVGGLSDYFAIPTEVGSITVNSLWHRMYNLVWNEWFRSTQLQDSVVVDKDDGPDNYADYVMLRRGKRHDYFTSALPLPQFGDSVEIPLGTSAPVIGLDENINMKNTVSSTARTIKMTSASPIVNWATNPTETANARWSNTALAADLTNATAGTITMLRQAFQIQRYLEKLNRGGCRYVEFIRTMFNVVTPSAGWRTEYLGGGSSPINIHPIAQTNNTGVSGTPQGNLAAMGTSSGNNGFVKSFTEHCLVMGLVSVRADLTYQQGLNRMFSYQTPYDLYNPVFANLSEQAILNKEIYMQGSGDPAADEEVFGYIPAYDEMRYKPSIITGKYRSTYATSLDVWHLSQEFADLPVLGDSFIQDNPPIGRVIAVPAEPHILFDSHFKFKAIRPMPTYSVPGLSDHF